MPFADTWANSAGRCSGIGEGVVCGSNFKSLRVFLGFGLLGSVGSGYVVRMPRASKLV